MVLTVFLLTGEEEVQEQVQAEMVILALLQLVDLRYRITVELVVMVLRLIVTEQQVQYMEEEEEVLDEHLLVETEVMEPPVLLGLLMM
jgi:hypothetical protein